MQILTKMAVQVPRFHEVPASMRTNSTLSSKKELGLPVGELPVKSKPKTVRQVLCFRRVPVSVPADMRTDMRTMTALSIRKELLQARATLVRATQKDRVALLPAKQDVDRLTAVFLGTAYFARETSNPVPGVTLVGQVLCQL